MENVLWNNEMNLVIGLVTEMDEEEFIYIAEMTHLEKTGEHLNLKEWDMSEDDIIYKLETI